MAFYVWLLSLSIMFSRFSHVLACISTLFLLPNNVPVYGCTVFCSAIHQLRYRGILRVFQTVFQSSSTVLHSHQYRKRIPISLHLHQHVLLSLCLSTAVLVGMQWNPIVVVISISLVINGVEHFLYAYLPFVYLLWRNIYSYPLPI